MRKFFLCALILIIFTTLAQANWLEFNQGIERAKNKEKHLIVDFYTTWCHWCKKMDQNTFNEKKVKKYMKKHFIQSKILADSKTQRVEYKDQEMSNLEFTRSFGIRGYPCLLIFDDKGEPVTKIPGYIPPEKFLNILKYIQGKWYKKDVSFEEYLKQ